MFILRAEFFSQNHYNQFDFPFQIYPFIFENEYLKKMSSSRELQRYETSDEKELYRAESKETSIKADVSFCPVAVSVEYSSKVQSMSSSKESEN